MPCLVRLEHVLNTLKTPPELIDAVLKQVEHHCQSSKNRTIDESYLVKPVTFMKGKI